MHLIKYFFLAIALSAPHTQFGMQRTPKSFLPSTKEWVAIGVVTAASFGIVWAIELKHMHDEHVRRRIEDTILHIRCWAQSIIAQAQKSPIEIDGLQAAIDSYCEIHKIKHFAGWTAVPGEFTDRLHSWIDDLRYAQENRVVFLSNGTYDEHIPEWRAALETVASFLTAIF